LCENSRQILPFYTVNSPVAFFLSRIPCNHLAQRQFLHLFHQKEADDQKHCSQKYSPEPDHFPVYTKSSRIRQVFHRQDSRIGLSIHTAVYSCIARNKDLP